MEADAATLAGAPWAANKDYAVFMRRYFSRVFGVANADQARRAYDALEEATLYCRAHLFNVGFCWEGRYVRRVDYPQKDEDAAKTLFAKARDKFKPVAPAFGDARKPLFLRHFAFGHHVGTGQDRGRETNRQP